MEASDTQPLIGRGSGDESMCPICEGELARPGVVGTDRLFGIPGSFEVAVCRVCGAGVTFPQVDADEVNSFYPDEYDAYQRPDGLVMRALLRIYHGWRDRFTLRRPPLAVLLQRPPGRLLDVGCGKGEPSGLLLRHGWSVVGIDPSPAACALARAVGIDAREGTLEAVALDEETERFDAVLFHHSLEHVVEPLDDLSRAQGLLRDTGILVVSAPNFDCWQRRRFGGSWFPLELPRHRTHFSVKALRLALERSGFVVRSESEESTVIAVPLSLQYAILGRPLFRSPLGRRLAVGIYGLLYPLTRVADRIGGGGDVLTMSAQPISRRSG